MIKTILLTFGEHGYETQVVINGEVRNDLMAVYIGVRASDEPADIILQTVEGGGDVAQHPPASLDCEPGCPLLTSTSP